MAEQEDRWRVSPFVPNPHSRPEERIASALEYIATQISQINQKMDYFRRRLSCLCPVRISDQRQA